MLKPVASSQVAEYLPLVERLARPFVGRSGAEFDDLVQEGLIDVWRSLRNDQLPAARFITARMARWCAWLARQYPTDYEKMLPLDSIESEYHRLLEA